MRKFIKDEDNVCLKCKKGYTIATVIPEGVNSEHTVCGCKDISLRVASKGARRRCAAFEPKPEPKNPGV